MSRELLTIPEAAEYLGVKERWVRRQVASRTIEFIKVGHFVRFEKHALDNFIRKNRVPAQDK
jgi:excisionase family DNA binding protein